MKPRHLRPLLIIALLGVASLNSKFIGAVAQQSSPVALGNETALGISLYKKGDTKAAIGTLRAAVKKQKDDADAWFYLGLAYNKIDEVGSARKAFEAAVKIRPDFAAAHTALGYTWVLENKLGKAITEIDRALELKSQDHQAHYLRGVIYLRQRLLARALDESNVAISIAPGYPEAFFLKSQALMGLYSEKVISRGELSPQEYKERFKGSQDLLRQASDSLERFLHLKPDAPDKAIWQDQLETMKFYASRSDKRTEPTPLLANGAERTRARIKQKPEPEYTKAARWAGVSGTVILRAVFSADGQVEHILVLQSLPHGLTQNAIEAAKKIKFTPATKEGRPVSTFAQLEYTFSVY